MCLQSKEKAERDRAERERIAREKAERREKDAAEQLRLKRERQQRAETLRRERIMMERFTQEQQAMQAWQQQQQQQRLMQLRRTFLQQQQQQLEAAAQAAAAAAVAAASNAAANGLHHQHAHMHHLQQHSPVLHHQQHQHLGMGSAPSYSPQQHRAVPSLGMSTDSSAGLGMSVGNTSGFEPLSLAGVDQGAADAWAEAELMEREREEMAHMEREFFEQNNIDSLVSTPLPCHQDYSSGCLLYQQCRSTKGWKIHLQSLWRGASVGVCCTVHHPSGRDASADVS